MLPLALVLWLSTGCFVLEEIDNGMAIMEAHTPHDKKKAAADKKKAEDEAEGSLIAHLQAGAEGVASWWGEAKEPAEPQRDPSDVVVNCDLSGRTQFLRKSDCRLRGGRVL